MQLALAFRPRPVVVVEHVVDEADPGPVVCSRCRQMLWPIPLPIPVTPGAKVFWVRRGPFPELFLKVRNFRFVIRCLAKDPVSILKPGDQVKFPAIYFKPRRSETLGTGNQEAA